MARVIAFFPTQLLCGNYTTSATYYSEVFEVTDIATLEVEFRIHGNTGTAAVTGLIEHTEDPCLQEWTSYPSMSAITGTPATNPTQLTDPMRYVRARILAPNDNVIVASMTAVCRNP